MMNNKYNLWYKAFILLGITLTVFTACGTNDEKLLEGGVIVREIKTGQGMEAAWLDRVTVHYEGFLENGTPFDRSTKPGREPLRFTIGAEEVIPGLEIGVKGMKAGGKRIIHIPAILGYGKEGAGDKVPPDANLVFEVEMIRIERFD